MTLFDYFQTICLGNLGNMSGVQAAALNAGFERVGPESDLLYAFMKSADDDRVAISANFESEAGADPQTFHCTVAASSEDKSGLAGQIGRWANVKEAAALSDDRTAVYFFAIGPDGRHRAVDMDTSAEEQRAMMKRGGLFSVSVSLDATDPMIDLNYFYSPGGLS